MNTVFKIKLIIVLILFANISNGQIQKDTNYIKTNQDLYGGVFAFKTDTKMAFNNKLSGFSTNEKSMVYRPNTIKQYGLVGGYKTIGVRFVLYKNESFKDPSNFGTTEQKALEISYIKPRSIFEMSYKKFDGMYSKKDRIRKDISTKVFFLRYHYIFNAKKFSYKAAFAMGEQQVKSASTWLLYANLAWYKVNSDSTLIPLEIKQYNLTDFKRRGASIGGGYAASVGHKRFFLTGFCNVAMKFSYGTHRLGNSDNRIKDNLKPSPNFNFRASLVYNTPKFGLALIVRNDYNFYKTNDVYVFHDDFDQTLVAFIKFGKPSLKDFKFFKKTKNK